MISDIDSQIKKIKLSLAPSISPVILGDDPIVSDDEDRSEDSEISEKEIQQGIKLKIFEIQALKIEKD